MVSNKDIKKAKGRTIRLMIKSSLLRIVVFLLFILGLFYFCWWYGAIAINLCCLVDNLPKTMEVVGLTILLPLVPLVISAYLLTWAIYSLWKTKMQNTERRMSDE